MIWTAILRLLHDVVIYFIGLFPVMSVGDIEAVQYINGTFSSFRTLVAWANWWFPIDTIFFIISITIGLYVALFTIRVFRWIINAVSPFKI